jgi:hypothetical protein
VRFLFLDVDGVLNRVGYRPAENLGLRSWIEPELAARLSTLARTIGARLVLASDWRLGRSLDHLRDELRGAQVEAALADVTPSVVGAPRWREIEAWMRAHAIATDAVAIVDDLHDMGPLATRFVRTSPLVGLDEAAARAIAALFDQ